MWLSLKLIRDRGSISLYLFLWYANGKVVSSIDNIERPFRRYLLGWAGDCALKFENKHIDQFKHWNVNIEIHYDCKERSIILSSRQDTQNEVEEFWIGDRMGNPNFSQPHVTSAPWDPRAPWNHSMIRGGQKSALLHSPHCRPSTHLSQIEIVAGQTGPGLHMWFWQHIHFFSLPTLDTNGFWFGKIVLCSLNHQNHLWYLRWSNFTPIRIYLTSNWCHLCHVIKKI